MCDVVKQACCSQEGAVEVGCDSVRLSVPTHPTVRQEQTGAVLSAPPGTSNSALGPRNCAVEEKSTQTHTNLVLLVPNGEDKNGQVTLSNSELANLANICALNCLIS